MIEAGTHLAKIVDYYVVQSKEFIPGVKVQFSVGTEHVMWQGSLKEGKGREITINALITMGIKEGGLANLAYGAVKGALDDSIDYKIVVVHESYTNDRGETKKIAKVQWVNSVLGARDKAKLDPADFISYIIVNNIEQEIAAKRFIEPHAHAKSTATGILEEIPF